MRSLADAVETINDAAEGVVQRWLIVGATARDLVLHHAYRLPTLRATVDLDIAVAVTSWADFDKLQKGLQERGAELSPAIAHRLSLRGWQIDIVPFGGVEQDGKIVWPPANDVEMSVLGFEEASRHALNVTLRAGVTVAVASPPALLILKLVAWEDRHRSLPRHDAPDIRTLIKSYAEEWNEDRLYEEADDLLQEFGYNNSLAAAALLGRDAAAIAQSSTADLVETILRHEVLEESLMLAADMGGRTEENLELLKALLRGFQDVHP